ncbi:MAG: OmpW family protein [Burkholderiales bacterium]
MKKSTFALLAAAVACALPAAAADSWLLRVRAVRIDTANESEAIGSLAVPADAIHVSNKTIPELDISYFFAKNWAAELVLTVPQKHDVTVRESALGGPVGIGTFKHLPPTLTLQYHFNPDGDWRPYAGAGVNFTNISDVNLEIPTVGRLNLDRTSWGFAYGAGFDYRLSKDLYLNVDVKKVYIATDVTLGGAKVSEVKVDPVLVGVGLGWRF